jgi:hypothetical protein
MKATLNLFTTALEVDGHAVASARRTHKGWYWFSNLGRAGRKIDFPTKEAALRAASKSLGVDIVEIIQEADA